MYEGSVLLVLNSIRNVVLIRDESFAYLLLLLPNQPWIESSLDK